MVVDRKLSNQSECYLCFSLHSRLLMNNVNSISQMNSVACEHSSLIGHEAGKRPASAMMPGEKGPEGKYMFL